MSAPKFDRNYRNRIVRRNILLFIPPAIAFVYIVTRRQERDASYWSAAAFFVIWIVAWMVTDALLRRRYRCPACGAKIGKPSASELAAGRIVYSCAACAVVWDTGLRESDW